MKGVNTRTHFYLIDACFADKYAVSALSSSNYLDYNPKTTLPVSTVGQLAPSRSKSPPTLQWQSLFRTLGRRRRRYLIF